MSDRVVVMYEGEINGEFEGEIDRAAVGRAMGGVDRRGRRRADGGTRDRSAARPPAWRIERRAKPGGEVRYRIGSVAIGVVLSTAFALLVSGADPSQFFDGPLEQHLRARRPASSTCSP